MANLEALSKKFPEFKRNHKLSGLSWLRVGGLADGFFHVRTKQQLSEFLREVDRDIDIFPMGVGSNTIFRDGGFRGIVIRLGREFMNIEVLENGNLRAGAAVLDVKLAVFAADLGLDLTFLRTIPGAVGGAVAMNAGCYGVYMADVLESIEVMHDNGEIEMISAESLEFFYRFTQLPKNAIVLSATFKAPKQEPDFLKTHMASQLEKRAETQPVNELSCGSTFRNPAGHSSTGEANENQDLKAWKVIDDAGLRGAREGGAEMSNKHPNFLINRDNASAFDLESLGEKIRRDVKAHSGIQLEWEIKRVGSFLPDQKADWEVK